MTAIGGSFIGSLCALIFVWGAFQFHRFDVKGETPPKWTWMAMATPGGFGLLCLTYAMYGIN